MISRLLYEPTDDGRIQLFRYALVGALAFAVDFGLLWGLTAWGLHYLIAAAVAFLAGLTVNYLLSIRWVFRERTLQNPTAEFVIFLVIGLVGLGLNEGVVWAATEGLGLHYLVSKLMATVVGFCWNFTARKYVLFHGKR